MKIERKPSTALLPVPVVLLSVAGERPETANMITIAWVGTVCSAPPMLSVSIRENRFSYELVNKAREFVVNIPVAGQAAIVDRAGMCSGIDHDKFAELRLTPRRAAVVGAPLIEECLINLECVVRHQLALGSHDIYLAEIVATHYDEDLLDANGALRTSAIDPLAYVGSEYWSLGERLGRHGQASKTLG